MFKPFLLLLGITILGIACNNPTTEQEPSIQANTSTDTVPIPEKPTVTTYDFMPFLNQNAFDFVNDEQVIVCVTNLMGAEKADAIFMNMAGAEGKLVSLKNEANMCFVATSSIVHETVAYDAILALTVEGDEVWGATTDEAGKLGVQFPDDMTNAPKPVKDFIEMYQ